MLIELLVEERQTAPVYAYAKEGGEFGTVAYIDFMGYNLCENSKVLIESGKEALKQVLDE